MWFLQPGLTFLDVFMRIIAVIIISFLILPLHEYAHGWVAYKLGDKSAKASGRLKFSPIESFDTFGSVWLLLFNFGWAKPIPVDLRYFKNPRRDMALTALAGPILNVLAAILGGLLINFTFAISLMLGYTSVSWIYILLKHFIQINVGLAAFNLLPVGGLDGARIMEAFIPKKFIIKYYQNYRTITIVILLLLLFGFFHGPLVFFENLLYSFIIKITGFPFLAFL